jgi:hypothetical protein
MCGKQSLQSWPSRVEGDENVKRKTALGVKKQGVLHGQAAYLVDDPSIISKLARVTFGTNTRKRRRSHDSIQKV